jgi:short-subunit dehydrogenase involved in D-alanine esterification of teichoic acids
VLTFFCSVWALQILKDHPLYQRGAVHVFTLSLNDMLREHAMLRVMEGTGPGKAEWERQKGEQRRQIVGTEGEGMPGLR